VGKKVRNFKKDEKQGGSIWWGIVEEKTYELL
jgi:hypothetical protein